MKTLTRVLTLNYKIMRKDFKVQVNYPDGKGNHETTFLEVEKKWRGHGESTEWIDRFMEDLETQGVAYSSYAEYKRI